MAYNETTDHERMVMWALLKTRNAPTQFDEEIRKLLIALAAETEVTEKYQKDLAALERLHKLRMEIKPERVSRNTLAMVAGNLLGVLIIVAYEQKHVITSKGLAQLIKFR
jgi:hypothetical protein